MTSANTGQRTSRGRLAPALAVLGAGLLALSALSTSFWQADAQQEQASYRVGLLRAEVCHRGECQSRRLSALGLEAPWVKTAAAVFASTMVVAGLSLLLVFVGSSVAWRRSLAWVVAVLALFTAVLMILLHVLLPFDELYRGGSLIAAFGGLAASLLAAGLRLTLGSVAAHD